MFLVNVLKITLDHFYLKSLKLLTDFSADRDSYLTRERQDIAVNRAATRWYQSIAPVVPVITLNAFAAEVSNSGATGLKSYRYYI